MAHGAAGVGDAALISLFVRRLGRLVRLQRALEGAGPRARHRADLVRAAIRSTLVDLARLDQADLAAADLDRSRRRRSPRRRARRPSRTAFDRDLGDPARR